MRISNKKISLVSLGCAKNLVDSEFLIGGLKNANFLITDYPEESDIVIVNNSSIESLYKKLDELYLKLL